MTGRLLCGVALVAHVFVLVICTDPVAQASSSLTSETSPLEPDSANAISPDKPKKTKCHRVKKCLKNEEYSRCSQLIQRAQYCSEKGQPYQYSEQDTTSCKQACVCKENYLRDDNGNCIPADKCPTTCDDNETLINCPGDCASDYCPTAENNDSTFCDAPKDCPPPACKCRFNYRRATNGTCIPTTSCPPFDCSARPNEEYDPCPPICPTDDCSQASPTGECPKLFGNIGIVLTCNPKCRCKKGYWRLNGECVPYGQCPGVCPANERYSECIQGECRALNCTQKDQSVPCVRLDPELCLKGCVCEEGFLRNESGVCVPQDQCTKVTEPPTCPPNEQFSECTQIICRAQRCEEKNWPIPCPSIPTGACTKGCVCQVGYLRDDNGDCIPDDQCIPNPCYPSEEFSNCTQAVCRPQNCSDQGIPQACPSVADDECLQGCVCQEGYLRAEDGFCVPESLCKPNVCLFNEEWSECVQAICRHHNCSERGMPVGCGGVIPGDCISGCVCKANHLRNESGFCVPEEECDEGKEPDTCAPNEELSDCSNALCRPLECSQKDLFVSCPIVSNCIKKCVCKYGYLRDENGVCVPEDQCPTHTCPLNEQFSDCIQAICRAQNCSQKDGPIFCPSILTGTCREGCVCQVGYLRNDYGICVPENECTQCRINQELQCVQSCPPEKTCNNRGLAVSCAPSPCENKCVCKQGYVKDDNNECIPEEECPGPCKLNEELSNCTQAVCRAQNCSDQGIPQACPSVVDGECLQGCVCQEGYLRAEDGNCVPEDLCSKECGTNQELRCVSPCPPQKTCANRDFAVSCAFSPCEYNCVCKPGFVKDNNDECILEAECDKLCSQNEEWSECVQATCRHQNCTQKGMDIGCPGIVTGDCIPGCICKENYLRDESGFCIPEKECDEEEGPKSCPPNEDLVECANALCRSLDCSERGIVPACPSVSKCIKDCVCKYGYLRDENGVCVPREQCPEPTCRTNEQFSNCTQAICKAQFCSEKDQPIPYPGIPEGSCEEGCVCKDGFLRDDSGRCVPEGLCKEECGTNQELQCVQSCPPEKTCNNRGLAVSCAPSPCEYKCVCRPGFVKDDNDECILEEECDKLCSKNEERSECVQATCRQNCTQKGMPIGCQGNVTEDCTPGCICKANYLRHEAGFCVPEEECDEKESPKSCPPKEDLVECANALCRILDCSQRGLPPACPSVSECIKDCVCKDGYLRDENGVCIPREQCPEPTCRSNELFSNCTQAICRAQLCSEKDEPILCPSIPEGSCQEGCVCKEGYFYDYDGNCVAESECIVDTCPPNEELSQCANAVCGPQNCTQRGLSLPCPQVTGCDKGCVCKQGFLRNENGDCVPEEQCPPQITCGENEELEGCPSKCTSDSCPKSANEEETCLPLLPCTPACKCRFNHKRAENGTCIPTTSCPPFDCSHLPNEEYVACPPYCPSDECGPARIKGRCPFRIGVILECFPKCQCKPGYGRVNGTCVPFEECPSPCPANEEYSSCIEKTCRPQNCTERDMKTCSACTATSCQSGCVCKENYYRNDKGYCVSYEECEESLCPNANEVYTPNFKECPPNTCNSLVAKYKCDSNQKEGPGCLCAPGYLRLNTTSPCTPICDCPEMAFSPDCPK